VTVFSRRIFLRASARLAGLSASAAGLALLGSCQLINSSAATSVKVRRVGFLAASSSASAGAADNRGAFVDQLRQHGWVQGENLAIEWRYAEGRDERLPELAADLVSLPVEVIYTVATSGTLAAKQQTSTIPIVFASVGDPVAAGLVGSLARPGGNITGTSNGGATVSIKSVELLKTVVPQLSRLAILEDESNPARGSLFPPAAQTAAGLGIQILDLDVRGVEDVDGAFETARTWSADGLLLVATANLTAAAQPRVAQLAARDRLPAMYEAGNDLAVAAGGLMAFGVNLPATYRQVAEYVDRILRGASPADLPVEEPREFDFIVNVKAAQALGITFSPDAAAQVTRWFQ
jgi:putative tryptophan/tyrosine transport system substrate-binding protein